MRDVDALIEQYGLEDDGEHVIVPFLGKNGKRKKRYILKRSFVRVMYQEGFFVDYPLADVIRATIAYPEMPLSESLYLLARESG